MIKLNDVPSVQTRMRNIGHVNAEHWFGYVYQGVEEPRLQRHDQYARGTQQVTSVWAVDGERCADAAEADRRLATPPVVTAADWQLLQIVPTDWADIRRTDEDRATRYVALKRLSDRGLIEWDKGRCRRRVVEGQVVVFDSSVESD